MLTRRLLSRACNILSSISVRKNSSNTVTMYINSKEITVTSYYTVMQAVRSQGIVLPSFCYHDRLSIAGNCRMCIVQVVGVWKPQIACAIPVANKMNVLTNSEVTLRAQESVLEFILADHPLDCPICDQGGECDLQDLAMKFGNDRSRFTEIHFTGKRAVESKDLGPLIGTEMNRCIHCTRCIRFASQVCGLDVLGSTGRGSDMLVGTFVEKYFLSELSGNIIDLCPVGALTSIPYNFKARPWEIVRTNSIDVTDATGTNISINHRGNRVLRVLPRENGEVNQEWLSDKGRWAIDSLEMQRLVSPMKRVESCLKAIEWDIALKDAACLIKECECSPDGLIAIAGPHSSVETLVAAKDFLNKLGSEHTYVERGLNYAASKSDLRAAYSLNMNMKDIQKADKILLIGTNPRFEAPILNAWIRLAYVENECDIFYIGPKCDFNYYVTHVGEDLSSIATAIPLINTGKYPLIFLGISLLGKTTENFMEALYSVSQNASKGWNPVHIIPREASWSGALEAGWLPGGINLFQNLKPKVLISLGADETFYDWNNPSMKIIYIGFQGDNAAGMADLVLPGCAYTEAGGVYLNMECRAQQAWPAVSPPGKARADWKIIRAIAETCCVEMKYSDAKSLNGRLSEISPNFVRYGEYQPKLFTPLVPKTLKKGESGNKCEKGKSEKNVLDVDIKTLEEYYCSCIFSANSPTMIKAQKAASDFKSSLYAKV